jgi:hypothetical protein
MLGIGSQSNKNKTNQNECGNKTQKNTIQERHHICGSPDMGYIHGETTNPSFIPSNKMKG